jgi:hypothetical protein
MPSFESLLQIDSEARDTDWESLFLRALPEQKVRVLSPDPQQGPDGWPYLFVETGPFADEPARGPLEWLASRGIGMAINPGSGTPDCVLTYGMAWNFRERGALLTALIGEEQKGPFSSDASGPFEIRHGQALTTGAPSAQFLPPYARSVLRQFFLDQGLYAPKILMVGSPGRPGPLDLCFSLESLGTPPASEHPGILEAVSWFLPRHYSLALLAEKAVPGAWQAL